MGRTVADQEDSWGSSVFVGHFEGELGYEWENWWRRFW